MDTLVNKVANSGLITINMESWFPTTPLVSFDIKPFLFMEMILKEKDFRLALADLDVTEYQDKIVCVYCSTDAIIPVWAYMLIAAKLQSVAAHLFQGTTDTYLLHYYTNYISKLDVSVFQDERIVIKGCSDKPVPPAAYMTLTEKLLPLVKSIMYGEPCSTVPVFKRK